MPGPAVYVLAVLGTVGVAYALKEVCLSLVEQDLGLMEI